MPPLAVAQPRVVGGHLGEQFGAAPPVHHDVVDGPQHSDAGVGEPDDRDPGQWCGGEVRSRCPVRGAQCVPPLPPSGLRQIAPVVLGHGQGGLGTHHLHRVADVGPDDGGAQNGKPLRHPLPGPAEKIRFVDVVEHQVELDQVQTGVPGHQRVEEHPALHRGQRVDVLDGPALGEALGLGWGEVDEWSLRRGVGGTAVRTGGGLGQFPDGRGEEEVLGGQPDAVGPYPGDDLDGQDGVAADCEEVVGHAHALDAEDLGPHLGQQSLGVRPRSTWSAVDSRSACGAGSARRSTLPLLDRGSTSMGTNQDGIS